jgi:hypothetical protein
MPEFSRTALFWAPRVLSIAFLAFLSLFALDVFDGRLGFWQTVLAFFIHLIPVFVLAAILILAWRWEWIGAALYAAAGLLYVFMVVTGSHSLTLSVKVNRILVIAGPAFVIAGLFLANWLKRGELRPRAQ